MKYSITLSDLTTEELVQIVGIATGASVSSTMPQPVQQAQQYQQTFQSQPGTQQQIFQPQAQQQMPQAQQQMPQAQPMQQAMPAPATMNEVLQALQEYGKQHGMPGAQAMFAKLGYPPHLPSLNQEALNRALKAFKSMQPAASYQE